MKRYLLAAVIAAVPMTASAEQYLQAGGWLNIVTDDAVDPGLAIDFRGGIRKGRFAIESEIIYSYNEFEVSDVDFELGTWSFGGNLRADVGQGIELAAGAGYARSEAESDVVDITDDGYYAKGEAVYVIPAGAVDLVPGVQAVWIDANEEWTIRAGMGVRFGL